MVKYNNKFYIYIPANNTNYVVWADIIAGPWSDSIDLKIGNIDPGHFVDDNGNRFLYFSNGSYVPLSKDGLSVIGKGIHAYDGWKISRDSSIECFCLEGPKMIKKGEYYYVTVAEGGTAGPATSHMVISARSKSPFGPWGNAPNNPIIRTNDSSKKMVTFALNDINKANVSIYDANNKLLYTEKVYTLNLNPLKSNEKIVKTYDLNPLADGVYYLVAESKTKVVKYEILVVNETATIMSDPYSVVYKTVAVK